MVAKSTTKLSAGPRKPAAPKQAAPAKVETAALKAAEASLVLLPNAAAIATQFDAALRDLIVAVVLMDAAVSANDEAKANEAGAALLKAAKIIRDIDVTTSDLVTAHLNGIASKLQAADDELARQLEDRRGRLKAPGREPAVQEDEGELVTCFARSVIRRDGVEHPIGKKLRLPKAAYDRLKELGDVGDEAPKAEA